MSPPSFEPLHKLGSNKKLQHQKLVQSTKIVNGTGNKYIHSDFLSFNLDVRDVNEKDLPESFDYRNQSVVGDVKDQKQGSICYIFATIAAMESSYMLLMRDSGKLKPGELVHFSEMDTLNCMVKLGIKNANDAIHEGGAKEDVFSWYWYRKKQNSKIDGLKLDKYTPPFSDEVAKVKR